VASRQHVLTIQPVIEQALTEASVEEIHTLDAIAVTNGPGLAGSLLVGVNAAKGMAFAGGVPLLPVNHLEGHIYSNWLDVEGYCPIRADRFPLLVLIVSGGHTELVLMLGHGRYRRLGGSLDDAAGEAFDKVARLLGLGFPGGPAIQQAAEKGDPARFDLPRPLMQKEEHRFNFSFSGLKTAVINLVRELESKKSDLNDPVLIADLAASFQAAATEVLIAKTADAANQYQVQRVCICGGVSANSALRRVARDAFNQVGISLHIPPLFLCTDNAAMVAAAAHRHLQASPNTSGDLATDVIANLPLPEATPSNGVAQKKGAGMFS
jgi:N6-L-threonylcarbamoyladenine synthase